jgi:diguanylate cyclase (GGDEF)-like protein/PAS domain S-box-containing protein
LPHEADVTIRDPLQLTTSIYRALLETAPDGVVVVDEHGTIRLVNRQTEVLLGWGRDELVGQSVDVLIPERAQAVHPRRRAAFMAHPTTRPMAAGFNLNARRSDGTELPVDISLSPVPVGDVVWVSAAIRDASARIAAEAKLRQVNEQLTAGVAALERRSRELALINAMGDLFQSCLTTDEAADVIGSFVARAFPDTPAAIYLARGSSEDLRLEAPATEAGAPLVLRPEECLAIGSGKPFRSRPGAACPHLGGQPSADAMCLPLVAQDALLGLVSLRGRPHDAGGLDETLTRLAPAITEHVSLALANVKLREALQVRSIQDALTGLFNRRHLDETIDALVLDAEHREEPLAVLAVDLDDFKRFNDGNGHRAGDVLLRQVADLIRASVRPADLVFRTGGDEFVVVLPRTGAEVAERRAQAFCDAIAGRGDLPVTASIGIAVHPEHGRSPQELLDAADEALYEAKKAGRNRVTRWRAPAPPEDGPRIAVTVPLRSAAACS